MSSRDGSVWIVFNGEIYNFIQLRKELITKGYIFRTQSDTEVIICLYEEYGADCVLHLRGMFAFAIWDSRRRRLLLARDRVGIKPLYYYECDWGLVFASEVKAILALEQVTGVVDEEMIDLFWTYQFLPRNYTMFKKVQKLLPGHVLIVEEGKLPQIKQYWDLKFVPAHTQVKLEDAAEELLTLLREAVRLHMISDAPVGFLLSGGVDSSAVLTLAREQVSGPLRTFTLGFDEEGVVDERPFARLVAHRCGTDHYETTLSPQQFWSFLPRLLWHLEEPVCEAPAVALHYVSQLAKDHVKVLLSGEGGDEAFAGYSNYQNMLTLQWMQQATGSLRGCVGAAMRVLGRLLDHDLLRRYGALMPLDLDEHYWSRAGSPTARVSPSGESMYVTAYATGRRGRAEDTAHFFHSMLNNEIDLLGRMLYVDTKTWLPDDLLLKADKVTMGNSLELRVPLLDHKILEYAASLPSTFKLKGREGKRILREAFSSILPREVLDRKKAGFPVPYAAWLAGPLLGSVKDLLLEPNAFVLSFFHRHQVELLIKRHVEKRLHQRAVFSLVVLELWAKQFLRGGKPA
jgi:asparagine synthase (glutamine-hydrolysing)